MTSSADIRTIPEDGAACIDALYGPQPLIGSAPRHLSWSKDSRYLAFVWEESPDKGEEIWIYSPSSGNKRSLGGAQGADDPVRVAALHWADERRLVYATRDALAEVNLDGEQRLIATLPQETGDLAVSPDGEAVAFTAGGSLWLAGRRAGTEPRRVYAPEERAAVESFKWSADGDAIAFVVADDSASPEIEIPYHHNGREQTHKVTRAFPGDETTHRAIAVFRPAGGTLQWLELRDPTDLIWSYEWAHERSAILIDSSDFLARHRRITVYDAGDDTGAVTWHASGGHAGTYRPYWSASWAPGDDGVILLSDHEGFYHLYHQNGPGEPLRGLTAGSWEIAAFDVDRLNGYIYFIANKDHLADRQMYRLSLTGGSSIERISNAPGTYTPSYAPAFDHAAFLFSDDATPPDAHHVALRGAVAGEKRRITRSPRREFDSIDWAAVEYVEFESHIDGAALHGRLYVPNDFALDTGGYPLIVGSVYSDTVRNNWGGRSVHPTWGLDQCLVAAGYLVFSVNVRGSWGQGREFRRSLEEFGSLDIEDIESGVRHLESKGYIDIRRVGIWGSSYGGLMAAMSLFRKPGLYAAGIAGAPATNVFHAFPGEMRVMGEPSGVDFPARYRRQSALYHSEGLRDPLMIIHGTRDDVVLYSDSIALAERLVSRGKTFELITLPGIGHHWDGEDPAVTRFAFKRMVEFLDRHVKRPPRTADTPAAATKWRTRDR